MDIAKIRKKFREAEAAPQAGPVKRAPKEEETSGGGDEGESGRKAEGPEEAGVLSGVPAGVAGAVAELLTFTLTKEEYAFKIEEIEEIVRVQRITRIPKTEPYLMGITSLRGKIIPVIDLRKRLSLNGGPEDRRKQKILVLKGPKGPVGALIDKVTGVIRLPASGIAETPAHLPEAEMKFIEGVAIVDGRFISVIRLSETISL